MSRSNQEWRLNRLNKDRRGAVLVEFLIAFMPLMITFSAFLQLQQMATAQLVFKHATVIGARGAAVMANQKKNTPEIDPKTDGTDDVKKGVVAGLGPWRDTMTNVNVKVEDKSDCEDPYGMISVTVTADYRCNVPFANLFMCGASKTHTFKPQTSRFPHQGARYQIDNGGATACVEK